MRDGSYDIVFSADGYAGTGCAVVAGDAITGSDGSYAFSGALRGSGQSLTAVVHVHLSAESRPNARLPSDFSMPMTGSAKDDGFTLIGAGPLGLIVQITTTSAPQPPPVS